MTYFRKSSWRTCYAFVLSLTFCLLQPASAQIARSLVATTPETAPTFPHRELLTTNY